MKRVSLAMFSGLLVILVMGVAIFPQANGQTEIGAGKLVGALRTLNTFEYVYRDENGRSLIGRSCSPFCDRRAF